METISSLAFVLLMYLYNSSYNKKSEVKNIEVNKK